MSKASKDRLGSPSVAGFGTDEQAADAASARLGQSLENLEPRLLLSAVVPNTGGAGWGVFFGPAIQSVIERYLPGFSAALGAVGTTTYLAFPGEANRVAVSDSTGDLFMLINENNNDVPVIVMPPAVNADFITNIDLGFSFFAEATIPIAKLIELPDADAIVPNTGSLIELIPGLDVGLLDNLSGLFNFTAGLSVPNLSISLGGGDGDGPFDWIGDALGAITDALGLGDMGSITSALSGLILGAPFDLSGLLPGMPGPFLDMVNQFIGFVNGWFVSNSLYVSTLDGADQIDLSTLRTPARVDAGTGNDLIIDGRGGSTSNPNLLNGGAGDDVFVLNRFKTALDALTMMDGGAGMDTLRIEGTPNNDTFLLTLDPLGRLVVTVNGDVQTVDLTGIERIQVLGEGGDDALTVDASLGLLQFAQGINFNGGDGTDTLTLQASGMVADASKLTFEGVAAGAGTSLITVGETTQTVNFEGLDPVLSSIVDNVAGPITVAAAGDDNAVTVGALEDALVVEINSFMTLDLRNKTSLRLETDGGADTIAVQAQGLPAVLSDGLIEIDAGPGPGDAFWLGGTSGDDAVQYTPVGAGAAEVVITTPGNGSLTLILSGLESAAIDAGGQSPTGQDSLTVTTNSAVITPGAFPGEGTATGTDLLGQPLLALEFSGFEADTAVTGNIAVIEGTAGNDWVTVANGIVTVTNLLGGSNTTDVSGFNALIVNLLGGGDTVFIGAANNFVNGILIDGGDPSLAGDSVTIQAGEGTIELDFVNRRISGVAGGGIQLTRVEHLAILGSDGLADEFRVTGYGLATELQTVVFSGGDGSGDDGDTLDIALTVGPDQVTVAPTGPRAATIRHASPAPTITVSDFSSAPGSMSLDGAGSVNAITFEGTYSNDLVYVIQGGEGTTAALGVAGESWLPVDFAGFDSLKVAAGGGDDELVVDNSGGLVDLAGGVFYDGGVGYDTLTLIGPQAVTATYDVGPAPGAGRMTHTLGDQVQVVFFANLEPVVDLTPGSLVVNGTETANTINYTTRTVPAEPTGEPVRSSDWARAVVSVDEYEPIEFANKSSLTINGLAGNDRIDLNDAPVPVGLLTVVLDGGSGDDVLIGSAAGDLIHGGRGNDLLQGLGGDDVLLGEEGDDTLEGGLGDDSLDGGTGSDNLDGGPGFDSAFFAATDEPDNVFMDPSRVIVNEDVNTIADLERVTLETGAGADDVQVDAEAGIPGGVLVFTGSEDDTIRVNLANPAPATVIDVDGGDGFDTATVKGAVGDDQFTEYGSTNVFGAAVVNLTNIEEIIILEGRRIDTDPQTVEIATFKFIDADGNQTAVRMSGPGMVDVFRNIVNGRAADIYTMELIGTVDYRTALAVNVRSMAGTDNETSIGSITGADAGAGSIMAGRSDLVGPGIELSGIVGNMRFDDILDGADILLGGKSGQRVRLTADQVGDVDLRTGGILAQALVNTWKDGTIQASVLERVTSRNGSFGADLVNQRQDRRDYGLKYLLVRNGDLVSNISADRIKSVAVSNGDAEVDVTVTSDANTLRGKTAFDVLSVRGGDLLGANVNLEPGTLMKALAVGKARGVGGNVLGEVNVTAELGSARVAGNVVTGGWRIAEELGSLLVGGTVVSADTVASIRTSGSMGKVVVGAVQGVDFLAGISQGVVRHADTAGDFAALATIGSFRVKGVRAPKGSPTPRFMVDSNVSAATLGSLKLLNVDFADSALYSLDQGGAEIGKIVNRDTVDPVNNFVYPPKPGTSPTYPPDFINIL